MGEPAGDLDAGLEPVTASLAEVEGLPRKPHERETLPRQEKLQSDAALLHLYPGRRT